MSIRTSNLREVTEEEVRKTADALGSQYTAVNLLRLRFEKPSWPAVG